MIDGDDLRDFFLALVGAMLLYGFGLAFAVVVIVCTLRVLGVPI